MSWSHIMPGETEKLLKVFNNFLYSILLFVSIKVQALSSCAYSIRNRSLTILFEFSALGRVPYGFDSW